MGRKLATPLLGVLLWLLSIHSGTFANASIISDGSVYGTKFTFGTYKDRTYNYGKDEPVLKISAKNLNDSITFGENLINRLSRLETSLDWSNIHVQQGTPAHGQLIENSAADEALEQARAAYIIARASQHLMNSRCPRFTANKYQCAKQLTYFKASSTSLRNICSVTKKKCSHHELRSKYRAIDGTCNHMSNNGLGKSFSQYKRLLFPIYSDGIMEPRRSSNKRPLPSARLVCTKLIKNVDHLDSHLTLAFMQWSQFVGHDLSHTASSKMISSSHSIVCCDNHGYNLSPRYIHPLCMPIAIPSDDGFYSKHRSNCMSYVRSLPAVRSDCSFGPLEQMNQATHFLDGSHIYGVTKGKANSLREFKGGRLIVSEKEGRLFLPIASNAKEHCQVSTDKAECYRAGDMRVNLQPHLTAMHTFWWREHNRIARALEQINPHWNDEKLFEETRRIVVAELQHITYSEWLPALIGSKNVEKITKENIFKEDVDPSVSNSFATAVLSFPSTLMESTLKLYEEDRKTHKSIRLQDHFHKPVVVEKGTNLDELVRGLATQRSQKMDLEYIPDITEQLYRADKFGFDALSLDIQRGRDHGLSPYVYFREICGIPAVSDFDDLSDHIPAKTIDILRSLYDSPQDIDLVVGGMAETPIENSVVGPTFSCLIGEQMYRTRLGDRYFYTQEKQTWSFSPDQLNEIKKITLARIFCDNGDNIQKMQPNVFTTINETNPLVECKDSIERINLLAWKETLLWEANQ